jgi:DNA-binding response OmpR family regulator
MGDGLVLPDMDGFDLVERLRAPLDAPMFSRARAPFPSGSIV